MINSPDKFGLIRRVDRERTLAELAELAGDVDILLTEGFKRAGDVRIEISRFERSDEPICEPNERFALVTDHDGCEVGDHPVFGLDDVAAVAERGGSGRPRAARRGRWSRQASDRGAHAAPGGWGPARYYRFEDAPGTIGVITPMSHHFCGECNRLRLTADGMLRTCLFSDEEIDVRNVLRGGTDEDVREVIRTALANKPESHSMRVGTLRRMSQIGG